MKTYSMVAQSMSVVLFAVAVVCLAAAAQPKPDRSLATKPGHFDLLLTPPMADGENNQDTSVR